MKTASENVLRALAGVTSAARAGDVAAVAIVAVAPNGQPQITFGGEAELVPSVNIGLDLLKMQFLLRAASATEQKVSAIVRPAQARSN